MNEVLNNIYTRRSIRKFTDKAVSKELIDEVVKAGTYAPSGKNMQTFRFFVMQNADSILALQEVVGKGMENPAYTFYGPNAIVIVACDKDAVNGVEDGSCALENMMLAAHSLGLGSCWINQLKYCGDKPEVAAYLDKIGLPENRRVVGILALGYAAEDGTEHARQEGLVTYLD
ncbi:nitroreductase family protein [Faecalicatena contorta]|uniref:nitroreductase family protein n=1 Tax=Faecalicatena contorta TaxID=39482 RepID=UPI001F3CAA77|nr:nitroreductase [Faecalicatena contorta]MCF2554564.1 nitroreductase [Faecalicatena contorta]MCF2679496.1 nitroreductase [Faecalicatena contorta]